MKGYLTRKQIFLLLSVPIFNFLIYNGGRLLAKEVAHKNWGLVLDAKIPFLPWMILIYWGCVVFWIINYGIGVMHDKGNGFQFLEAHFIGEIICFFCFACFPTTMIRPEHTVRMDGNILEKIVCLTYRLDEADNLFPSIHCFVSWLCWIAVRKNEKIPVWYQVLSLMLAILVCISTLTVKQHVIADVVGGIVLAEMSYLVSGLWNQKSATKSPLV